MNNRKEKAFQKINSEFEQIANLVLQQLDAIAELLIQGEMNLPESKAVTFFKNEEKIDQLEVKLSERVIHTIALYQPLASEIRHIFAVHRIVNSVERIGDHAVELLNFLHSIKSLKVFNELADLIISMFEASSQLVQKALQAFVQQDLDTAKWVLLNNSDTDQLNTNKLKKVIDKSKAFEEKKKVIISFITIKEIIDEIERVGDHAGNIAEATIYFIEGKDIRHTDFDEEID